MSIESVLLGAQPYHIEIGDVLSGLQKLPDESIHCAVTSPPYWNQRDYDVEGQIGSEKTVEGYICTLVRVFHELKRVLRPDGTFWLNLGDKMLDKQLLGIPWRVALQMQSDGWVLRDEIIWHKPDTMPSSASDRTTRAHEQVFMFSKSERYFYDNVAIMEDAIHAGAVRKYHSKKKLSRCMGREPSGNEHPDAPPVTTASKKNRRSVWTIGKQPFKGAHFAVFPPRLVEPCVLAGTSEYGCCITCGSPHKRVVSKSRIERERPNDYVKRAEHGKENVCANSTAGVEISTLGWESTCKCGLSETRPCVVLDPFSGAATTGLVCQRLNRRYIGIELNPAYAQLSIERMESDKKKCTTPPAAQKASQLKPTPASSST